MKDIKKVCEELKEKEKRKGYYLNSDENFTLGLVEGLLKNEDRYGYWACPCRLASGDREKDLDIICPCDYRDQDIAEYGSCYCGLYVNREVAMEKEEISSIPERRGTPPDENIVWRCKVCGYICARPEPPDVCPICSVDRDRFEKFSLKK